MTPRPSGPAASVWRLQPPPHSAEPRPRQLQKMAAKAAPVATLPRAGGGLRGRPATPLPSASRHSPPGRPDPRGHRGIWGRSGGREGRGRGGYLPEEGAGVEGGKGPVPGGRSLSGPPIPHAPCPREVAAPGWGNANGLLTSVTACSPLSAPPPPPPRLRLGWPTPTPPQPPATLGEK